MGRQRTGMVETLRAVFAAGLLACGAALGAAAAEEVARVPDAVDALPPPALTSLPQPLSRADVLRYRQIFALQKDGKWRPAANLTATLDDRLLLGDVRAQKFLHPTKYRSRFGELQKWLKAYADHPDATRLYRLALRRRPSGGGPVRAPTPGYLDGHGGDITRMSSVDLSRRRPAGPLARQMLRRVDRYLGRGFPTGALRYLRAQKAEQRLRRHDFADAMARVARGYFVFSKDREALEAAQISLAASDGQFVLANWTAGLAAWRLGDYQAASSYFGNLGRATTVPPGDRAAGAYWASRAHLILRQPAESTSWLVTAALNRDTFYGLLARRNLGVEIPIDWDLPALRPTAVARVASHPNGRRALALIQVGQDLRAERHLRKMAAGAGAELWPTLMTIAARHNMPGLSLRLAAMLHGRDGRMSHAGMYPVPDWRPENGFNVDQALLLAIARQESRFNVRAKSGRGARGLMQLMPRTAAFIGARRALRRDRAQTLFEPRMNMSLAQKYITHLLRQKQVDGDLFRVLAAYNAGPGSLSRWLKAVDFRDDPLLFIEAIPSPETRNYIEQVLTNLWMYRLQMKQRTPALDLAATGKWPRYIPVGTPAKETRRFAWN